MGSIGILLATTHISHQITIASLLLRPICHVHESAVMARFFLDNFTTRFLDRLESTQHSGYLALVTSSSVKTPR